PCRDASVTADRGGGPMRAALTAAELERRLAAEFPEAFHADSGLAILEARHRAARVRLVPPGNSLRPGGTVSGPTLMMLADVAMYVAVLASIGWGPLPGAPNPKIKFLS